MTVGTILALILLITFLVTLILAIGSYAAYKIREKRKPKPIFKATGENVFFDRYVHTAAAQASRERLADAREAAAEAAEAAGDLPADGSTGGGGRTTGY